MAALDAGVLITADTEFFCPGHFQIGNAVFHCWKKGGHGTLSMRRAIKESCDVFFYHTADTCGIDRIAAMANRFGLGVELGIEIPGERHGSHSDARLEAGDHRRDVAARRHDQLRHRPGLCLGDAAAACDLCGAARDRRA